MSSSAAGRQAAGVARRDYERGGVPVKHLRRVQEHSDDGTVLPDCAKVYHLSVTPHWIELQQPLGLPRWSTGGMSRYRISEVETWLREPLRLALRGVSAT